jgi:catechol 2,3-dioxygenase-like lactoylglutathione lyase family enzyme
MISYVTIGALDGEKSVAFYDATLGALGYSRAFFDNGWAGYGQTEDKQTVFVCPPFDGQPARAGNGVMVAFAANSCEDVAAAHAAALANGGSDEGAPGYRPPDGDAFYAAYMRDPTGNKLAVVFIKS